MKVNPTAQTNTISTACGMTSKERVRRVLRGETADRVPIGFFAIDADTIEKVIGRPTYLRSKAKTQIAFWEGRRDEVVGSWKRDMVDLYRKLDFIDMIPLGVAAGGVAPPRGYRPEAPQKIDEKTWTFKDGRVFKYSAETDDIALVHDPQKWTRVYRDEDYDLDKAAQPLTAPDPSIFEFVDAMIAEFGNDRYIMGPSGGEVGVAWPGDMERGLMELGQNPDLVRHITEYEVCRAEARDVHYVRPGTDGVVWGQDLAHTRGPLLSPKVYRSHFLPLIQRRVRRMHEKFNLHVLKHACGNNWKLLDAFVDAGYDAYQSIQTSADMDLARLKTAVGNRLTLWGGVQVETLTNGTPADVRKEVDEAFRILAPGGRFILSSSHSVAVGTRYENFMAMLDRYLELCDKGA